MAFDKNKALESAAKLVQRGNFDKAIREYTAILKHAPGDLRIQQKLGELHQKQGEVELAARAFRQVAEGYSSDGFFNKAVAVYKQVLNLTPGAIDVLVKLGDLHKQLGLVGDALSQYQAAAAHHEAAGDARASMDILYKMVELEPDNVASRVKLAELYAQRGLTGEAISELKRAADYLKEQKRPDDYVRVVERLAHFKPDDYELARELASKYLEQRDAKRALTKLQLCFKANPKEPATLNLLVEAFEQLGQQSRSAAVLRELAAAYEEKGSIQEAREALRRAQRLSPTAAQEGAPPTSAPARGEQAIPSSDSASGFTVNDRIQKLLSETDIYIKYGLHEKTVEHLKRVLAIDPDCLEAHERSAAPLLALGNARAACEALDRSARICFATGQIDRAKGHVRAMEQANPEAPELQSLRDLLGMVSASGEIIEIGEDSLVDDDGLIEEGDQGLIEDLSAVISEPVEGLRDSHGASRGRQVLHAPIEPNAAAQHLALESAERPAVPSPGSTHGASVRKRDADADALALSAIGNSTDEGLELVDDGLSDEFVVERPSTSSKRAPTLVLESVAAHLDSQFFEESDEEVFDLESDDQDEEFVEEQALEGESFLPTQGEEVAASEAFTPIPLLDSFSDLVEEDHTATPTDLTALDDEEKEVSLPEEALLDSSCLLDPIADEIARTGLDASSVRTGEMLAPIGELRNTQVRLGLQRAITGTQLRQVEQAPSIDVAPQAEANEEEDCADELAEAEILVANGAYEEARELLQMVLLAAPDSRRAAELFARIEAAESGGGVNEGYFDLAAEIASESLADFLPPAPESTRYSASDVFNEFKRGVEQQVRPEDADTHYDLGIAYKEMGLLSDAIAEFKQAVTAAQGRPKEVESLSMLGLCYTEQGEHAAAVETFERALGEAVDAEAALALRYELGLALERAGDSALALTHLIAVSEHDSDYRDVEETIARIQGSGAKPAFETSTRPGFRSLAGD